MYRKADDADNADTFAQVPPVSSQALASSFVAAQVPGGGVEKSGGVAKKGGGVGGKGKQWKGRRAVHTVECVPLL
jgi:hypothetical protein